MQAGKLVLTADVAQTHGHHAHGQTNGRMRMRIRLWHFRFNLALHRFWSLVFRVAAAGGTERNGIDLKPKWSLCHLPFLHFNCMLRPKVCNLSSMACMCVIVSLSCRVCVSTVMGSP